MDTLQEARGIINEVDEQMATLFVRRMQAAQMVAEYKKIHSRPCCLCSSSRSQRTDQDRYR